VHTIHVLCAKSNLSLLTGKSYRAIGREIAHEIERVFEAKVNPLQYCRFGQSPSYRLSYLRKDKAVLRKKSLALLMNQGGDRRG